jgi:protein SCO1/2
MRSLLVLLLALLLSGCGGGKPVPAYKGSDITGADFGHKLALTDHNGRAVGLESFKGKLVVLFFGYTHCPDVCPTTLSDMAQALKLMRPEDAARVQVLFVSVDPERDTPETLKAYVPYFHSTFLGLHGTPEQVAAAAKEFKIIYRKHVEPGASGYLVDHSAGSYVIDTKGEIRLYLPFALPAADIAHDLAQLLAAA